MCLDLEFLEGISHGPRLGVYPFSIVCPQEPQRTATTHKGLINEGSDVDSYVLLA